MSKTNFEVLMYEALESTGEMKLTMKYYSIHVFGQFLGTLKLYILEFPWKIVFGIISGNCLYL